MLKLLSYLINNGVATSTDIFPPLEADARGLPTVTQQPCSGNECNACKEVCPTNAIEVIGKDNAIVSLDRGACIGCGLCIETCPTQTIIEDKSTRVARRKRQDLILSNQPSTTVHPKEPVKPNIFKQSVAARVVSTGCTACDLEIGACGNPIFDIERFGVSIVASPRFADALLVTGPVSKGMQNALHRCYEAMAEPKIVIAVGTCAISGGVHKNSYTNANGADQIVPVDVYIPGCPPHPWSIIYGIMLAMGRVEEEQNTIDS